MLTWLSVDARTGVVNDYLPDLEPQGPCAVTIGRYESLGFNLHYPKSVIDYAAALANETTPDPNALPHFADFNQATREGASVLIALDESGLPCWGGLILTKNDDETEKVTLATVTMEAYFDRRIAGPYTTIGEDQNQVVADIINQFILDGVLPGIPIRVVNTASAYTTSQTLSNYDDRTVYSVLGSLSSVQNGPQWTIGWEWRTAPVRITPVLYVADRLGSGVKTSSPTAVFSLPGSVIHYQRVKDWSSGKGATQVTATGQGQGLTRPTDTEVTTNYQGRPTFEFRYAPQQTALSTLTVQQHALAGLAALQNGTVTLALTAAVQKAPVLGADWFLGDDVGYDLTAPGCIDGSLRGGVGRCVGWQRDDLTVTPVLFTQDASQL